VEESVDLFVRQTTERTKTIMCFLCMSLSVDNFGLRNFSAVYLYQVTGGQTEMNNCKFINRLGPHLSHMVINTVRKSSCLRRNNV
jgi:hypothetical protein